MIESKSPGCLRKGVLGRNFCPEHALSLRGVPLAVSFS